ncbi:hypothetical protein SMZ99_002078 [Cronobacter sakazakii]|nr:hypothetical protein [Cronobacter sakazakii]ELY4591336.1 hypothetical protein [Cronobacter sakazakii]
MSLDSGLKDLTNSMLHNDLPETIISAEFLGRLLWHNHVGIYSLVDLEKHLIDRITNVIDSGEITEPVNKEKSSLFIVSEPFMTGGHTRLMERLAEGLSDHPDLLITRKTQPDILQRLKNYFQNITVVSANEDVKCRIITIAQKIVSYQKVVLNIHPDDIITVIGCGLAKKYSNDVKIYYVNHADHVFNYGVTIADYWFQISAYGAKIDKLRGLQGQVTFLGIPAGESNDLRPHGDANVVGNTVFMTAGSAEKYKPVNGYSIFPLLKKLLQKENNAILYAIGPNIKKDYWWWPLLLRFPTRVKVLKRIPYDKYMALAKRTNVCIDSHPIPGGTAFVEQFIRGKRCIGLISPFQGYTPVELLKSKDIEQIAQFKNNNAEPDLTGMLIDVHSTEAVIARFRKALYDEKIAENLCEKYIPWTGNIRYDIITSFNTIPRDFPLNNIVTKFAMHHATVQGKLVFMVKKILAWLLKISGVQR